MKLPVIILYTDSQLNKIDNLKPPNKFYDFKKFHISEYNSQRKIYGLCGEHKPIVICSFGSISQFRILQNDYFEIQKEFAKDEEVGYSNVVGQDSVSRFENKFKKKKKRKKYRGKNQNKSN